MEKRRPTVFIGSSSEGLEYAKAIQQNLDRICESVLWTQGVFGLMEGTLTSLVNALDVYDFAVLVLTPDDLSKSRGEEQQSPRDNVLLELGMFLGRLGPKRTFALHDRTADTKLPSDLGGVNLATFEPPQGGNHQSAVGAACTDIEKAIQKEGLRPALIPTDINVESHFQVIHDLLDPSAEQFIILMYEEGMALNYNPGMWGIDYAYETKEKQFGYGGFDVSKACKSLADADLLTVDLRMKVSLTDRGKQFARWLVDRGHKATSFYSPLKSWGTPIHPGVIAELRNKPF